MDLLLQLIRHLPMPAQLWDAQGRVLLTNERFNELLGLPALLDWNYHKLSLLEDPQVKAAGVDAMFNRALHGMPTEIHSFAYDPSRLPGGQPEAEVVTLFLSLRPLHDNAGRVQCVVCLISDFATGRSRYERELMRSQKMENIERLASGIAHEFNNIFTGIRGMSELIKDEVDRSSESYEFAVSIQQSIARGAELIQQLSSFARELPVTLRRRLISAYLQQALPLMQTHVQKRVHIEVNIVRDGEVLLDSNRMDQALANVLLNARDAMGGQGEICITVDHANPSPDVMLDLPAEVEWIMLEVADSGPGIADELYQRVLEPFFTTKERGKATGLGLSVTARIIASHNGVVQIGRSEQLGGAAVRIFLPRAESLEQLTLSQEAQRSVHSPEA